MGFVNLLNRFCVIVTACSTTKEIDGIHHHHFSPHHRHGHGRPATLQGTETRTGSRPEIPVTARQVIPNLVHLT